MSKEDPPPLHDFAQRAQELDTALRGLAWRVVLSDGAVVSISTHELLECMDRVHAHRREGKGPVPESLHPLVAVLRNAVGVPRDEGTLPMLLISLIQAS
jgi:hypothetical protein